MKRLFIVASLILIATIGAAPLLAQNEGKEKPSEKPACNETDLYCPATSANNLAAALSDFPEPQLSAPNTQPVKSTKTVTYNTQTRGAITADFANFKANANETLNDSRGWSRLGVRFKEVPTGGDFTLVLSEASKMTSFWSGCSQQYSCQTGSFVIINQNRWQGATSSWNKAGGSLRDYRHMVVNHETGHWLGHDHASCPGSGKKAAVMQQQSISLQGCKFNPWPLQSEIWSSRLGI